MPRQNNTKRKHLKVVPPPKPKRNGWCGHMFVTLPEGYRDGDDCFTVTAAGDEHERLYAGDTGVVYTTQDVTPTDLAAIEVGGADAECWLGIYRPAPGGYITLEMDGETERFKPGTARLLGRVVHVERRGEIVRKLRPIREGGAR
jgi:hypothetical protein